MTMFGVAPRMGGSKFFPRVRHHNIAVELARIEAEREERGRREKLAIIEIQRLIAKDAARDLPPSGVPLRISLREIARAVSLVHGISLTELMSERRQRATVVARQEVMWLAKKYTHHSLPSIGRGLGGRDHATVIHGIRSHQARIDAAREKRRGG